MALKNKIPSFFNTFIQPLSLRATKERSNLSRLNHTSCLSEGKSYNYTFIQSLLFLIILLLIPNLTFAEIRYVSKTGSCTPPYTSWETASDSIQKAINISKFGDTIYVANGVYKEQVVMIPGLSLIGSSMDSCIIDTREFVTTGDFYVIIISDTTLVTGFKIIVCDIPSNYDLKGFAFKDPPDGKKHAIIEKNRIEQVNYGIRMSLGADSIIIRKNIIKETQIGLFVSGIISPSNIFVEENYISGVNGIRVHPAGKPFIKNNVIVTRSGNGIHSGFSGTPIEIINNIIIQSDSLIPNFPVEHALTAARVPATISNNIIMGYYRWGMTVYNHNKFRNNILLNIDNGFNKPPGDTPDVQYNNVWNVLGTKYAGFIPDSTNLSVNPMFNDTSGWDFRLQKYSPMIDAGDPSILDLDGTRSDMGAFGGPFGMIYDYEDLAPGKPRGLELFHKKEELILKWRTNSETDVTGYNIYYDSVPNFPLSSKTFFINNQDTIADISRLLVYDYPRIYIKVTAVDSAGNESPPSEEVLWGTSGIKEDGIVPQEYQLFQNYPNPFNPSTTIGYRLKERGYVKLIVYDIKGETVEVLTNNWLESGYHEVSFNPVNKEKGFASGIYLYKLEVINENRIPVFTDIKKMILLK